MSAASDAKTLLSLYVDDIDDAAHSAWEKLHSSIEADCYDCLLCDATMYACMDYTHKPTCPTRVLDRAIEAYRESIIEAAQEAEVQAQLGSAKTEREDA